MISRFGLSSGSNATSSSQNNTSNSRTSISGSYMPGMSSFTGITKKMSDMTASLMSSTATDAVVEKKAVDDRKAQISQVLAMLEDVHLQIPPTHAGLIIAYTAKNMSPILNPGIKFTWYRMKLDHSPQGEGATKSSGGGTEQIDENNKTCWYAPSIDDIGCMICVQCEDNYDQGCSKYLECGPIEVDPLVKSIAENAVTHGTYETKDVFVSIGLASLEDENHSTTSLSITSHDVLNGDGISSSSNVPSTALGGYPTVLSKEHAYLQLPNSSMLEIDTHGIFISVPTTPLSTTATTAVVTGNANTSNATTNTTTNTTLNTSRRGLRIPRNEQIKVQCVQATTLLITLPVTATVTTSSNNHQNMTRSRSQSTVSVGPTPTISAPSSPSKSPKPPKSPKSEIIDTMEGINEANEGTVASVDADAVVVEDEGSGRVDDEHMKQFLTSSTITIPWSYEGHHLSPAAYIQEEEQLQQAELDSISFANTVVNLAEFISSLPEGTTELLICCHCSDRLARDLLALSIRMLVSSSLWQCENRVERKKILPWYSNNSSLLRHDHNAVGLLQDGEEQQQQQQQRVTENASTLTATIQELKHYIKTLEEQNIAYKKEQKELIGQLVSSKEELSQYKLQQQQSKSNQNIAALTAAAVSAVADENNASDPTASSSSSTHNTADAIAVTVANDEINKQLTTKLHEYEYQIQKYAKQHQVNEERRETLETNQSRLQQEHTKVTSDYTTLQSKHTVLNTLYEQMKTSIMKYETQQEEIQMIIKNYDEMKVMMEAKKKEYDLLQQQYHDLLAIVQIKDEEHFTQEKAYQKLQEEYKTLQEQHKSQLTQQTNLINQLEIQLTDSLTATKRLERELSLQQDQLQLKEEECKSFRMYPELLSSANSKYDVLQGEYNHVLKKLDSQTKEMKKSMKENASTLLEFEKALARKSGECNELYFQLTEYREAAAMTERNSMNGDNNNSDDGNNGNGGGELLGEASAILRRMSTALPTLATIRSRSMSMSTNNNTNNTNNTATSGYSNSGSTTDGNSSNSGGVTGGLFKRFSILNTTGSSYNSNGGDDNQHTDTDN